MRTFFLTLALSIFLGLGFSQTTVVDIIVNSEDHDTLETAVSAAGLVDTLSTAGPFTVFAPTDDAFALLPEGILDTLLADPTGDLTDILLYHVLSGEVLSTDLMDGMTATTLNGKDITVTIAGDTVFINDAMVTTADIQADNGVVHVIDAVLVPPTITVVDIIVESEAHDTLEAAVTAAGLVETLSGEGPFTVFAPTDDAFAALPAGLIDDLLADPTGALTDILLYHVLSGEVLSTDLMDGMTATTLNGDDITVTISNDSVFINDAYVSVADIQADNGVVHVIDAVLTPPEPTTVVDIIIESEAHDTLEAAVTAAGLVETLSGEGPFTVFAPTDDAFAALPAGLLDDLLADPTGALTDILLYHVLSGEVLSTDLMDGMTTTTLNGDDITVTISNDSVFINDAYVSVADIQADNGVVHVIDAVLVPPTTTVVDIIVESPDHNTLEAAVVEAGLVETLSGEGPFTVFAPTDSAFAALPEGLVDALLADPTGDLTTILLYHVLSGEVLSTDLMDGMTVATLNGNDITVTINDDGVFINDAMVTVADIQADNGVVHVIDAVLVPSNGGEIELVGGGTEITLCAGDGEDDIVDATVTGEFGLNTAWILTDAQGIILDMPEEPPFNFEGGMTDTVLIWHLSWAGELEGAMVGASASDLGGNFDLSNPITVILNVVNGGEIELAGGGTEIEICAGDGVADSLDVTLTGAVGANSAWVITDTLGNILDLPAAPPFDFENAEGGVCLIWHLSFADGLTGAEVGANAADLAGCFDLSNPITVIRNEVDGGEIELAAGGTEIEICAGDGVADSLDVTLTGAVGTNSAWVITDTLGNILDLPAAPPFDFENAEGGVCLIWHLSFEDGLTGAEVGANAADLAGCFDLSNPITVIRNEVDGGEIELAAGGTEIEICAGDGVADSLDVTLTGAVGANSAWVITDTLGNILDLPAAPPFDFENAEGGVCLIWHLSFEDGLTGAEVGANAADLAGCFDLSNPITVIRNEVDGGEIELAAGGTEIEICAGDGVADSLDVTLTGAVGTNSAWVITDTDANILDLPAGPPFVVEEASADTILIWHLSFEDGLTGAEVGANAADLAGCFDLSNPITVIRNVVAGGEIELAGGGTEIEICAGDGVADSLDVTLTGAVGTNSAWVITDTDANILDLPAGPPFVVEDADAATILIWHLSFEDGLTGAEIGANAADLEGCFDLSTPITVIRNEIDGGEITTSTGMLTQTACTADGGEDYVDVSLTGAIGSNSAWVVTDQDANILALPTVPFSLDTVGTEVDTFLVWHLSFEDGLTGAEVGANAADLEGCFALSNPITVIKDPSALCDEGCLAPVTSTVEIIDPTTVFIDWPAMPNAYIYVVWYRPVGSDTWKFASVYSSRRTIKNLQPGTMYEYQIQTLCLPEESPRSPISTFSTPMFAREVPINVQTQIGYQGAELVTLDLMPNPVVDNLRLSYGLGTADSGRLAITHISGQVVFQTRLVAESDYLEVDMSNVPSGYYFVTLNNGKEILTKKLVKANN